MDALLSVPSTDFEFAVKIRVRPRPGRWPRSSAGRQRVAATSGAARGSACGSSVGPSVWGSVGSAAGAGCGATARSPGSAPPTRPPPPTPAAPPAPPQDKSNPKDWAKPENLTILPPEADAMQQPLDRFKAFFSPDSLASMFK
jgi:hypothetical protein